MNAYERRAKVVADARAYGRRLMWTIHIILALAGCGFYWYFKTHQ